MNESCFLCGLRPVGPLVRRKDLDISYCAACGLGFLSRVHVPEADPYAGIHYYDAWGANAPGGKEAIRSIKQKTAFWMLEAMAPWLEPKGRILEVGCAFGHFLEAARQMGYAVAGVEISPAAKEAREAGFDVRSEPLREIDPSKEVFNAVVMVDVIEHLADPEADLVHCRKLLKKNGSVLALVTPDVASIARKISGPRWTHFKQEHLFYYSRKSLTKLLARAGFKPLHFSSARKGTSLQYMSRYSRQRRTLPDFACRLLDRLPGAASPLLLPSELFCIARPA